VEEDEAVEAVRTRRRIGVVLVLVGGVAAGLLAGWIERKPIVTHFVDRKLAAAQVPASFRLAAIGPFVQQLEDVRIGDPAAPDLVAKSVVLQLGYGLRGPYLRAVSVDGVRLSARVASGRVSLGAIDRLLPTMPSGQPLALPDMDVTLADTRIALATPSGAIAAEVEGTGNLRNGFRGKLATRAPMLAAGGCAFRGVRAQIDVHIQAERPTLTGPVDLAALSCPRVMTWMGKGRAVVNIRLASSFDRGEGGVSLTGFGGVTGSARFESVSGLVTATGDGQRLDGTTGLTFVAPSLLAGHAAKAEIGGRFRFLPRAAGLVFSGDTTVRNAALAPTRRRAWIEALAGLGGSPIEPLAHKFGAATGRLLADVNAAAHVSLTLGGPGGTALSVKTLALAGRGGSLVRMRDEGDGIGWQARDGVWRIDGHVTAGGGGLPALDVRLWQGKAGTPVGGVAWLQPYAAGGARLAPMPVHFGISDRGMRFDTVLIFDGPLPAGQVTGLRVPVFGHVDGRGAFAVGKGCAPVAFQAIRAGGMSLDPGHARLCGVAGAPLISRAPGGALRYGAIGTNLRFTGRSGAVPLVLASDRVEISATGLSARKLAVWLGKGDSLTRLELTTLDGRYQDGILAGRFADASAQIGHVPLLLEKMAGDWEFASGTLVLNGGITVSDMAPNSRFLPLISHDATLRFGEGRIDATATLREPNSDLAITNVDVHHNLAAGHGYATLDVPGIVFAPKSLQPEALTPLTLGVIANVNGTIAGQGLIDWTVKGVTSHGDFHTDGLDLAAAFGPVSKIVGTIHFSDLLDLVTAPNQTATIAEINPGIAVSNGVVHYRLPGAQMIEIEDADWPFAGGDLSLDPTLLSFGQSAERHLTFRVKGLDAAAFVQQLAFPNISATGTFDGVLPMIFDQQGARIEGGTLKARREGGTLAYIGELSTARIGTMGKLAFDALKAVRYQSLTVTLDGRPDGEIISAVKFDGVRQATGEKSLIVQAIANLPFRFNIMIRAPFRGLMGSARAFVDPSVLLSNGVAVAPPPPAIQPAESESRNETPAIDAEPWECQPIGHVLVPFRACRPGDAGRLRIGEGAGQAD
jgi:hypothetical protein